jgi:hypothetical protein
MMYQKHENTFSEPSQVLLEFQSKQTNHDLQDILLLEHSEDQVDSSELSDGDSQPDSPQGMMSTTFVDTLHQQHENVFSEPSRAVLELPSERTNHNSQHILPLAGTLDSPAPSSKCEHGDQKRELASSACRKPNKLRGKMRSEPRRHRNKNHATPSTPDSSPSPTAIPHAHNSWHRSWSFILAGVVVLLVAIASFAGQAFHPDRSDESTVTTLQTPGNSRAWAATTPHEASSHSRNRKITSVVRSIEIELARAKAVASHLNSKMGSVKREYKQQCIMSGPVFGPMPGPIPGPIPGTCFGPIPPPPPPRCQR